MHERERLDALYKIAQTLGHEGNINATLRIALGITGDVLGCHQGSLIAFDEDGAVSDALILHGSGTGPVDRDAWEVLIARGLIAYVRHGQRTIIIRDLATDPRWPRIHPSIPVKGSAIGLPIIWHGRINGVLTLSHEQIDYFDGEAITLLETIARLISSTVNSAVNASAAHARENRYRMLFDGAVIPILMTDLEGIVLEANQQAHTLLKAPQGKLTGRQIASLHRIGSVDINQCKGLKPGEALVFRSTAQSLDGHETPTLIRVRRTQTGDHAGLEWVEQDITDIKELEQLRRELPVLETQLRGVLTTLNASLTRTPDDIPSTTRDLLRSTSRSTELLTRALQTLNDIQRMQTNRMTLHRKPMSLYNLLATSAQRVQSAAQETGHILLFNLANDLPVIQVDGDLLMRVVVHLLENAVLYTPPGGQITLSAHVQEGCVHVRVADTGRGIPAELHAGLFSRDMRANQNSSAPSLQLGLVFCRMAVEVHGGTIGIDPETSSGAVFHITLPLVAHRATP